MRAICMTLLTILSILFGSGVSTAGENNWRFVLTPTLWASGIDIDSATVRGRDVSADFEFGDIWDHLDFGGAVHFEVWKGEWGVIFEELYIDLGLDGDFQPRIGPRVNAALDIRFNLFEVALARRFDLMATAHQPEIKQASFQPNLTLVPMAGVRYGMIKEKIDLQLTPSQLTGIGETTSIFEDSEWWLEIFIGGRLEYGFHRNWSYTLGGDIGGIKDGDETVLGWKVYTGVAYQPWDSTTILVGYKIYDFNYENNTGDEKIELNAMLHGPNLAVAIHF